MGRVSGGGMGLLMKKETKIEWRMMEVSFTEVES